MTSILSISVRRVLDRRALIIIIIIIIIIILQHRDGLRNGGFNVQRGRRICPFTETPITAVGLTHPSYARGTGEYVSTANATESSN
jgi:hypothetical protein